MLSLIPTTLKFIEQLVVYANAYIQIELNKI